MEARQTQALVRQCPGLQVAVDELQYSSIRDPLLHQTHQLVVVDPVEGSDNSIPLSTIHSMIP